MAQEKRPVEKKTDLFRAEVDRVGEAEWNSIVERFADATIHQTWAFGALRWGTRKLSHLVLYEDGEVVAAAQLVTLETPILKAGIAHCKFGPMWRLRDRPERPEVYDAVLGAMRREYADNRGLLLRLKPWETDAPEESPGQIRSAAGLHARPELPQYHTFVLDMRPSLEELRAGLHHKWRYNLKKAERQSFRVTHSASSEAAASYMQLYKEMRELKTFVDTSEVDLLPDLMAQLPADLRPEVFIAYEDEKPVAAIVISLLGRTGYYLFGATGNAGRDSGASYVLFWQAMEWLKERDCAAFDLVGSQPQGTGGATGYRRFKSQLTGNNGAEYHMLDWEASGSWRSDLVVKWGTYLRSRLIAALHGLNSARVRLFSRA